MKPEAANSFASIQSRPGDKTATLLSPEELAAICKALGHPARVRIVEYLQRRQGCICGEIVEILPLAQSTVSQHLKLLMQAGLIQGEVEGPRTCYCLQEHVLERFKRTVAAL